jgi:phosphatidylglycerol lysyltransferase
MSKKPWFRIGLSLLLLGAALYFLGREVARVSLAELWKHAQSIPVERLGFMLAIGAANYLQLTRYDVLALRYLKHKFPYPRVAFVSFIASTFARNIGPSVASGGSVRYRFYSAWGLPIADIATLIAFLALTLFVGWSTVAGFCFTFGASAVTTSLPIPSVGWRIIGGALLALCLAYFALCARQPTLTIRGRQFNPPSLRIALNQALTSGVDWLAMPAMVTLLLPAESVSYVEVLAVVLLAQVAGIWSQVPGGLGVFEAVVIAALTPRLPTSVLLSSLLLYRCLYFFVPLAIAAALLLGAEASDLREKTRARKEAQQARRPAAW